MRQKTIILDMTKDKNNEHLFTLDYLYHPYLNTFTYKWQNDGQHEVKYFVTGCEEVVESLCVTRTLYVTPFINY